MFGMAIAVEAENQKAIKAYLNLLQNKGATTASLNQRKHFLRYLVSALDQQPRNGQTYRVAVDETLQLFAEGELQLFFQNTAREFYYFWVGDLRAVARLNASDLFVEAPVRIELKASLLDMLAEMDAARWDQHDLPTLEEYLDHLRQLGVGQAAIDVRERMLRLLHFVMRDLQPNAKHYRFVVDAMLPLFTKEDTRKVFIALAREYFYFWIERPALGPDRESQLEDVDKRDVAF